MEKSVTNVDKGFMDYQWHHVKVCSVYSVFYLDSGIFDIYYQVLKNRIAEAMKQRYCCPMIFIFQRKLACFKGSTVKIFPSNRKAIMQFE